MLRSLVAVTAIAVVVTQGCGGEDSAAPEPPAPETSTVPQPTSPPDEPYQIRLEATREGPQEIRVRGETNLPDEALITVSASRAFRYTHEDEVRAVSAARKPSTVSDATFEALLTLNERDMVVGLELDVDDPEFGPIAAVDRGITICAQFQTGEDPDGKPRQPSQRVREAVGGQGERLEGSPQVTVFGSATPTPSNWLEVTARVPMESPILAEIADIQGKAPKVARLAGFCF